MKDSNRVRRNFLGKLCGVCMATTLTVTGLGMGTFGSGIKADTKDKLMNKTATVTQKNNPEIVKEIKELRTENSITYLMSDGSRQLQVYGNDTENRSATSWYGYNFDISMVDSVQYLQNVNMHIGNAGMQLSDSIYSYGPLQNTRRYAYMKVDFTDQDYPGGSLLDELKNATIDYAYLVLTEAGANNTPGTVVVKSPVQDWDPLTITYANQPELLSTPWASYTCSGKKDNVCSFNISNWMKAVASGDMENYGLVLMQENKGSGSSFYGGDSANFSPYICINYTIAE